MSFSQKNRGFRLPAGGKKWGSGGGCGPCGKQCNKPKPVCVENCDPEKPLFVRLEEPIAIDGCLQVDNKRDEQGEKLPLTVDGSLEVKLTNTAECPVVIATAPDAPIETLTKVFNTSDCLLYAEVNAFAEVEGSITVNTCPSDPLCVEMDNKDGQTFKVDIGWNPESEHSVPVFGRIEICNCCDKALVFESEQFQTSEQFTFGTTHVLAGTSITDILAHLVQHLTKP